MIKVYLSHNVYGDEEETFKLRNLISKKLEENGFYVPWLYDLNDFKRNLLPEEIVGRCLGILSICDIFVMLDADKAGFGKMIEMIEAYRRNMPIYCICPNGDTSPWIKFYSTEIFSSINDLIKFLKENYGKKN